MNQQTFQVTSLSHEGRGIALYEQPIEKNGKKVFIQFALPGETVVAKITRDTKRLEEADAIEIIGEPAPTRVTPICQHFKTCGGCSLQHMHPDEQIRFKQEVLKSHFTHFAQVEPEQWLAPIRSKQTGYRRRARIGVRYLEKSNQLLMGFRERQSNRLTNIVECPVLESTLNQALPHLRLLLESLTGKAVIGHVELAMGDTDVALLVRHTAPLSRSDKKRLLDFALERGWQLYLQPRPNQVNRLDAKHVGLVYSLADFATKFTFSPLDFTQVNASVNEQMVKLACDLLALKEGERVLDLFCGLGNFSLPMATCVGATGEVVGVEGSTEMVRRAEKNATLNGLSQLKFYEQDLTQDFSKQPWAQQGFDALLIDPPRSGSEQVMQYISNFNAKRIVYVSCNPATLARDTGILTQYGYRLIKAGVMDMFTHTGHVESITLFERDRR